ncbi:hypothetical protein [Azospirillum agricola]|uniref:hypothetical protein n=1 Tax=Azospirillum agricola TaxID=1720247 RepID=UPI000A0F24B2|nr:hypothetical protein [Azospirillum agricola]SMH29807.1 hypothetical protein SAMN02982994_0232 [Azospirillum lipoferum]
MTIDAQGLREQVKANRAKLDGYPGPHQFEWLDRPRLSPRYRCTVCGGEADSLFLTGYEAGLKHGREAAKGMVIMTTPSAPTAAEPSAGGAHICAHGYDPNCTACEPLAPGSGIGEGQDLASQPF